MGSSSLGTFFALVVGMSVIIRVLLVDDKVELRQNIRRLLSFDDAIEIVGEAGNGREAIEQARLTRPDLILMDLNMPVMDGIQATSAIARELPEICSIMMSVQGENQYIRRAMQAGARDYLVKPFSNAELVETIQKRLSILYATKRTTSPTSWHCPTRTTAHKER